MTKPSLYSGQRCDVFNRDGQQCELPFGHGKTEHGGSIRHHTAADDGGRAWTVR